MGKDKRFSKITDMRSYAGAGMDGEGTA
jgi:hypothetical protein